MENNQLSVGDRIYQPNSGLILRDEVTSVTDREVLTVNGRRFWRFGKEGEYFEIHEPSSAFWIEKHMPWQLLLPTVDVSVPLFIAKESATAEGTTHIKQILSAAFTSFYQSGVYDALTPEEKDYAIQAQLGISDLIDSVFHELSIDYFPGKQPRNKPAA